MATLSESAPTEGVLPPHFSPASPDSGIMNGHCNESNDTGPGLQEEFHNYPLCHSRDSREETPVVSMVHGRGESSQDDEEDSGSESGLIGGKPHEERSEDGEQLQTCSSASGDGSSVWSEEGSNEQEPPHYSLLESSDESELSSPGGNPVPGGTLSVSSEQNHTDYTGADIATEPSAAELKNSVSLADRSKVERPQPLPDSPLSRVTTVSEDCGDNVGGDGRESEHGSAFVVNLVGHSQHVRGGEEGKNGEDVEVEEEMFENCEQEETSYSCEQEETSYSCEQEGVVECTEPGGSVEGADGERGEGAEVIVVVGETEVSETLQHTLPLKYIPTKPEPVAVTSPPTTSISSPPPTTFNSPPSPTASNSPPSPTTSNSPPPPTTSNSPPPHITSNFPPPLTTPNSPPPLTTSNSTPPPVASTSPPPPTTSNSPPPHTTSNFPPPLTTPNSPLPLTTSNSTPPPVASTSPPPPTTSNSPPPPTTSNSSPPLTTPNSPPPLTTSNSTPPPIASTSPPPPTTSNVSSASNEHRLTSSMRQLEDSNDPLLESNLDSSNLDSGVRRPRDSTTNLPILQPLSPDPDLNEQYEYLRRTLSHSRRRYSTRRRRPQRRQNREGVQRSESSVGVRRDMRDMLRNQESRRVETHVDVHGRTYFMDHDTHTVAYEPGQTQATDISRGMEMLERRYMSLQRSFRGQRPAHFAQPNLSTIPSSPSTPLDLSLSLTRAEAESISQANSRTPGSQSGTSHSKRKSSRWRFWQRSHRTVSQSRSASSADDDILPVSPGWEGSPPPSVTETGEVVERVRRERSGSRETGEGVERMRRDRSGSREGSVARSSGGSRSSDPTLGGSIAGTSDEGEGERGTEGTEQATSVSSEEVHVTGGGREEGVVGSGEVRGGREREARREVGGDEVFAATASAAGPSRHASIMRASGMSTSDRSAATRARHRVRATTVRSRHRRRGTDGDTDDETNEVPAQRHVQVTSPTLEEEEDVKEVPATPTSATPLPEELLSSPALRFITRRDLYTFLNKAGDAGEMFLANRGLMELVQRIRTNNNLFSKYQHSRHLVLALNRFADLRADLPHHWEKKLNREGKVFYIDHTHCLTSFIDPRLPLPDHEFMYTAPPSTHPSQQPEQLQFGEEAPIRAHHTTVMTSSVPSPPPPTSSPPSVSVTSPQPPQDVEMTYERQVVSFFRHPEIYQKISQRYQRGVRPQLREIIEDVRANGTSALERIQTSGSVAAYELALVLSLFEDDISVINTMIQIVPQQPVREERVTGGPLTASTLQRKKEAFSTKLQNFKVMMARLGFAQSSRLKFNIRREHLLEDSYEHVMKSDVRHLQRKRLNICFKGEDGLDYGGPSREFFFLLSREVFNPYYGLFEYSANDTYTVQISSTSMFIQNNLDWFRFAGRVIGLVIVQGFLLDVFFTRTIYKTLANRAPSLKDLESLEPAFYSSLVWIRENDPEPLDLTFTVEEEAFGELSAHELKEGGMDIPVTEDNKEEYIHLMLRWRLDRGITAQMNMLKKGFSEVMPVSLLQAFDASELEFLTAGTLEIDIDDWKKHTEYRNGYHPTHPVILYFWQAVEMFDNEQRLRLLQFVTGTSSVPFEGFKALRGSNGPKRFTIDFFSDVNSLPRTHTCFNRIDLPPYPSYDVLYHKLVTAIEEGNTFGIE